LPLAGDEGPNLLAHHWLAAEDWERALPHSVAAAKRADDLYARPEAISRYWQALEVLERLPANAKHGRIHADVSLALAILPGSLADDAAVFRVLQHVSRAIEDALRNGQTAMAAKLLAAKGSICDDEGLLKEALKHAEASGDTSAEATAEFRYCIYLGTHGQFEKSRAHVARAVELLGKRGEQLQQAVIMSFGGRCYSARAGRLDESLSYAARAHEIADRLDNARLRAIRAMEAEPYLYKGEWQAAVEVAEQFLPEAWDIREWNVVGCASAWLAISYL